jgi:hypothetical protein
MRLCIRPAKEMRFGIEHPIVQRPGIRVIEEKIKIFQRLTNPYTA